jgi:hypothetical protein
MGKFRFGFRLLAALTLLAGLANAGLAADPTAATLLAYQPKQKVEVSAEDAARCKVELEKGKVLPNGKTPTAWVVKDSQGRVLRKFHDSTGDNGVNIIAYFRDGEEVYRELISGGKIDQFRWVGPDGSKWGVDRDGDGKIDTWTVISPEELSQEVLAAVVTKDQKRLEALLLTKAELDAMGLPADEAKRIQTKLDAVPATFAKTCKELAALNPPTTSWVHLELKHPQTTPADSMGATSDLVRYRHAAILYLDGPAQGGKHNWIQAGELIQVGKAWRIVQAPTAGIDLPPEPETGVAAKPGTGPTIAIPPGAEKLIQELNDLDKAGPGPAKDGIITFNLKRAAILEKIAALYDKAEDREKRNVWIRQVADCLASAAQQGDKAALDRLGQYKAATAKEPGGILAYFAFRHMSAEYAIELGKVGPEQEKMTKFQEKWKEALTRFVNENPNTDDTPDAIMQLGMVNEYFGPKTEAEAKAAYALLVKNFPSHSLAKRAQGCLDRLSIEGKEMALAGPTLGGAAFNLKTLQGKPVVIYYWASWNDLAQKDFNKINLAMKGLAGKVELVGVNLDNSANEAQAFVKANAVPGTHLHIPGGLESPLAVQYGISSLPAMFLVGPDGKVITKSVQASTVDDELNKLFKIDDKDEKKDK